jgi:hypothetical protein
MQERHAIVLILQNNLFGTLVALILLRKKEATYENSNSQL